MLLIKLSFLIVILIASCIFCFLLAYLMGRLNWMRPGKPIFIIPMLLLAIAGCIPVFFYLPYLPFPSNTDPDAGAWIIFGGFGMNLWTIIDGLKQGNKKRKEFLSV